MDRGNRRFGTGTLGFAFPLALIMATLSYAAPPAATPVDHGELRPERIRQVVGQRRSLAHAPSSGVSRALAVEAPADSASASLPEPGGTDRSGAKVRTVSGQGGLLDRLFGDGRSARSRRSPHHSNPNAGRDPIDWGGIPYHQGDRTKPRRGQQAPIRDPGTQRRTQIIRGGVSRTLEANDGSKPAPTRVPKVMSQSRRVLSAEGSANADSANKDSSNRDFEQDEQREPAQLSTQTSSRRSNRRAVDTLVEIDTANSDSTSAASPSSASGKEWSASDSQQSETPVPRVARRVVPNASPGSSASETQEKTTNDGSAAGTALAEIADKSRSIALDGGEPSDRQPGRSVSDSDDASDVAGLADGSATDKLRSTSGSETGANPSDSSKESPFAAVGSGLERSAVDGQIASYRQPDEANAAAGAGSTEQNSSATTLETPHRASSQSVTVQPISSRNGSSDRSSDRHHASHSTQSKQTNAASEIPGVRVVTEGPAEIMIGQTHPYEVRVENRGSLPAEGVQIQAMIPAWAQVEDHQVSQGEVEIQSERSGARLVWNADPIPAGESERMVVRVKAAQSGQQQLDVDWTLARQTSTAMVHVHEPKLELTVEGPEEVIYGESQTYQVHVRNPGDGVAPNVVFTLSPNSPTPQSQRIGDIPPGKEALFEVELNARDRGDMKIHGLATGDLKLRAEASKTINVTSAKLEAMLAGPELKYQNAEANYRLELQNVGSATSRQVSAKLALPSGVEYLGGLDNARHQGQQLTWQLESLDPGDTRTYEFNCKMTGSGEQRFAFDCQGSAAGNASVSISTEVGAIADLALSISDPTAPAPVGENVTYEITIRNRGSKAASDVEVVAQFSHGIEPQQVEGHSGEILPGQVMFDAIDRIAPGEHRKLRVIAQAERAGHHRFRSELRSGDTVLVSEEATHFMASDSQRVSRRSSNETSR